MITKIEIKEQRSLGWTDEPERFINTACTMVHNISREYQRASNILDLLQYDHGVGTIEERLKNLSPGYDVEIKHHSITKRSFTIGILTITEED